MTSPPKAEAVTGMSSALRAIEARSYLMTEKFQEQQWRATRFTEQDMFGRKGGAHPNILLFEQVFLRRMAKLGVPMFAHCIVRTDAEQEALYSKGVTKARAGQSAHNHGCAVDLVHAIHGWNMPDESWGLIGHVGKEVAMQNGLKVEWGGDWKFWDPAHWEIANWKEIKDGFPFYG